MIQIKRVIVTAALPYANGPLHLGHIRSTYLPADIYARYNRLAGNETLYVCATDEHGTPIVIAAEKAGMPPKEFVDIYHKKDKEDFSRLGFSMDIFHRTSSPENRQITQHIFGCLRKAGHIYEKEVEQLYCEKCARFLPDRFVIGTCPNCMAGGQYGDACEKCNKALKSGELLDPRCSVCKCKPVMRKSRHYFFRLSSFSQKLRDYISGNPRFQKEVANYVLGWIDSGLVDWDISRDMDWGTPIPGEKGMVFYVWFDAPIGYIGSTIAATKEWEKFWKDDAEIVHFIGKDISYHHYLFWPATLMGAEDGFRMPFAIPVRGYLNLESRKFSKSKNWFVSIGDFLDEFPPDYLRYYETAITPHSVEDADFVWKEFGERINNELVSNLGNFVHRTLTLMVKLSDSKIPQPSPDAEDKRMLARISEAKSKVGGLISEFEFRAAQEEIMRTTSEFNKYLSDREPWKNPDKGKVATTLYVCSRWVSALATLLEPFLPFTSQKLAAMLGAKVSSWENADAELLRPGTSVAKVEMLFSRIESAHIKKMEDKLKHD